MKKLFTLFTLLTFWGFTPSFAQKITLIGTVADSAGKAMQNATVLLLSAKDSSLASFGRTSDKGVFNLKNVSTTTDYLLKITFVGYEPYWQDVKQGLQTNAQGMVDLGGIRMTPLSKMLDAALVTGYKDPVKINGDTTEFNASSFKVQPNAAAEDLIKKLPGMEVSKDGTVTAQGENVKQVLVNGKKFFGKDPKVALQNLPANAIDKVKVYDKKSDQAEFSGVDDGEREKTIDLQLKTDYSKGTFGNATAGGGVAAETDARYFGKFSVNKFSKTQQLSILGLGNNVNKTGFSVEDYMGFTGTTQRMQRGGGGGVRLQFDGSENVPLDFGNNKGFQTAWSGGINFNQQFSPKTELNVSYFYNDVINEQKKISERENFLTNGTFKTNTNSDSRTENQNHRVNLTLDQKLDTFTSLKLTSVLSATKNFADTKSFTENLKSDETPQTNSDRVTNTEGSGLSMQNSLLLRRRFMKKGRNASANFFYNLNTSDRNSLLNSTNKNFLTGKDSVINQDDDRINKRSNYGATLSYTEPLGNRQYLEANYNFSNTNNDADRQVYDLLNGERKYNSTLSNVYNNDYIYNKTGLTYRVNRKEWNFATGLQYQYSTLQGEFISRNTLIGPYHFNFLLPNLRFDYNPVQGKSMRFAYETSVREPSIDQLQPIRDNTDPLNIYNGNPELRPEYNNRFSVNFNRFNQSNFHMFFGNFNFTYTTDKISTAQTIDQSFRRETKPINVKNDKQGFGFLGFGMPLYKQILRMNVNSNLTYGQGIAQINNVDNVTNRLSASLGLRLNLNIKDTFDLSFNGRIQSNSTKYSLNTSQNQQYYNYSFDADANYRLPFGFKLSTDFDYSIITGQTFGTTQAIPIWGASISKFMLKKDRGELKLAIYDILNRNTGINRTADVNYILNEVTSSLGRYAMLTFTYNINPMMGGQRGGMRMMMQRF
ncbi:MAG: outer membrane beta-barrel protein [Saprospiraceae bacterium]|nr:outer membrane beta-barrel protein [Saprospiraceae bacterium]